MPKPISGVLKQDVVVITDLDILMDFHEHVWGIPVGPVIEMTKSTYRYPKLVQFKESNVIRLD